MVNLLPFEPGERLNAVLTTREYPEDQYLIFATKSGTVKKTPLSEYSRPRSIGIIAINLREDDELVDVARTDGSRDIMLFSDAGKAVRFNESSVRSMGRDSTGVRGMNLDDGQRVIALCVVAEQGDILTITENGYGKRTPIADYPQKGRGTKGVISIACSARNGQAVCAVQSRKTNTSCSLPTTAPWYAPASPKSRPAVATPKACASSAPRTTKN